MEIVIGLGVFAVAVLVWDWRRTRRQRQALMSQQDTGGSAAAGRAGWVAREQAKGTAYSNGIGDHGTGGDPTRGH